MSGLAGGTTAAEALTQAAVQVRLAQDALDRMDRITPASASATARATVAQAWAAVAVARLDLELAAVPSVPVSWVLACARDQTVLEEVVVDPDGGVLPVGAEPAGRWAATKAVFRCHVCQSRYSLSREEMAALARSQPDGGVIPLEAASAEAAP